jgi:hypothetical protein
MRNVISVFVASFLVGGLLMVPSGPVGADQEAIPSDFLTGGGFIIHPNPSSGSKANFAVGGGVKNGAFSGHLEYADHGIGLNVHGTSVTAYFRTGGTVDGTDPKTGQPTGTRDICGTAQTNSFGDVFYRVRVADKGEPGVNDTFMIKLVTTPGGEPAVYTTELDADHRLGEGGPGGGNIQLHKGNPSNTPPGTPPFCGTDFVAPIF